MILVRETTVASPRWHDRVYPALGPEGVRQLEIKIEKLQRICETAGERVYELEERNAFLERQLETLQTELVEAVRARRGFQQVVSEQVGFRRPDVPERDEYGFFTS